MSKRKPAFYSEQRAGRAVIEARKALGNNGAVRKIDGVFHVGIDPGSFVSKATGTSYPNAVSEAWKLPKE